MKTALIAAAALAAATFANPADASAKGVNFGLTIAGQDGVIQIGGKGKNHGSKYGNKKYGSGYNNYGYGNRGYNRHRNDNGYGYRQPNRGGYNLQRDRVRGYCMYPNEIRRMLRYQGWQGFRVRKLTPQIAIIHSNRNGMRYRLKLNRCTGEMIRVKPLGGYGAYGYY